MALVWKHLNRPEFAAANALSELIDRFEWRNPGVMTPVNQGSSVWLIGDYGGDHQSSKYRSYSLLIVNPSLAGDWEAARQALRDGALGRQREMAFKKLRDKVRLRALPRFLAAAETLSGVLLTILVQKNVQLFSPDQVRSTDLCIDITTLPSGTLDRMCTVAHFGGLLLSALSAPGQDVFWISDHDEIAANPARTSQATQVLANISSHYLRHDLNHFRFGSLAVDDATFTLRDLASIPDLAAGTLAEVTTAVEPAGFLEPSTVVRALPETERAHVAAILRWLGDRRGALARLSFVIDPGSRPETVVVKALNLMTA